jgi:hypothetical protein
MKKKLDKLNLAADIFKAREQLSKTPRTPNKTALSRTPPKSPRNTPARQDPPTDQLDLFQKVCCPNCRYVFKVLRGEREGRGGTGSGEGVAEQATQS